MSQTTVRRVLLGLAALGALARFAAWYWSPGNIHPDEIYQTVEPAWWHLHGVGLAAWEWQQGVRSWVLPAYHGAWMALLESLGVRRGDVIGGFLQLHWAVLNLLLIPAAYRGGTLVAAPLVAAQSAHAGAGYAGADSAVVQAPVGWLGGLIAAALCGFFPLVVHFAPHTLSELPSMLCLVGGLVLTADLVARPEAPARRAILCGFILSLGICIRIANGPLVLLPPIWLLARRRFAHLGYLLLGALAPALLFGLVDLVTWGRFAGSYIGYIQFNFIEGRAAQFGVSPWDWYLRRLLERAPLGLPLLLAPLLVGLRGSWPFALSALGLVVLLSTQGHKEERFIIAVWPLLLIGAGGALGGFIARAAFQARRHRRQLLTVCAATAAIVVIDNGVRPLRHDLQVNAALFAGQAAAGRDARLTGMLVESIFWNGGSTWLGKPVPQLTFEPALLANPIISHVMVTKGSPNEQQSRDAGFVPFFSRADVSVLRRP